jgi:hypothetical protein
MILKKLRWQTFSVVFQVLNLAYYEEQNSLEKLNKNFPANIYTVSPCYLQSFMKFCWAVSEETGLTDGSRPYNPCIVSVRYLQFSVVVVESEK